MAKQIQSRDSERLRSSGRRSAWFFSRALFRERFSRALFFSTSSIFEHFFSHFFSSTSTSFLMPGFTFELDATATERLACIDAHMDRIEQSSGNSVGPSTRILGPGPERAAMLSRVLHQLEQHQVRDAVKRHVFACQVSDCRVCLAYFRRVYNSSKHHGD